MEAQKAISGIGNHGGAYVNGPTVSCFQHRRDCGQGRSAKIKLPMAVKPMFTLTESDKELAKATKWWRQSVTMKGTTWGAGERSAQRPQTIWRSQRVLLRVVLGILILVYGNDSSSFLLSLGTTRYYYWW
jgi:hypothetical protein